MRNFCITRLFLFSFCCCVVLSWGGGSVCRLHTRSRERTHAMLDYSNTPKQIWPNQAYSNIRECRGILLLNQIMTLEDSARNNGSNGTGMTHAIAVFDCGDSKALFWSGRTMWLVAWRGVLWRARSTRAFNKRAAVRGNYYSLSCSNLHSLP